PDGRRRADRAHDVRPARLRRAVLVEGPCRRRSRDTARVAIRRRGKASVNRAQCGIEGAGAEGVRTRASFPKKAAGWAFSMSPALRKLPACRGYMAGTLRNV